MGKCHMTISHITVTCQDVTGSCHIMISHNKCGKVVHRLCSSCISSVQNQMGSLSTWTWNEIKLSQAKSLHRSVSDY